MSKRSHDENIRVARPVYESRAASDAATCGVDGVQDNVYTMARQMLGELRPGPTRINNLLIGDCYDAYTLRLLQYRKSICDGPGCRPTEVPSHDHSIYCECVDAVWCRGQDERGAPRSEYDRFGIPSLKTLILRHGHGHNCTISKAGIFDEHVGNLRRQTTLQYPLLKNPAFFRSVLECGQEVPIRSWSMYAFAI